MNTTDFFAFWDRLNGKPYEGSVAPPSEYTLQPYGYPGSGEDYALKPLAYEDMARYAADDVASYYAKIHDGKNPYRLGEPLDDDGWRKYTGVPKPKRA